MISRQKSLYCIDTIPSGRMVLALWQHALKATSVWLATTIVAFAGTLFSFIERSKQRKALAYLDDHLLEDIGVPRRAAQREIAKPFWRP